MSKIDKLAILGIRSFDNQRQETIQFNTPLTLIVGHNGSGKTTIIECLKYATTGDLPPNSKGGAFIHDPKLCGEKEVLAQVKLSFKGTSGAKLVVTRSMQLTVKKTTRQQKTLEGQLLMLKDGERTSISSRVAELDQIMPQYLGVSKAILDAVIFCHQDESLWPMSEPSVLKKKFDEIFEALKYTKAIDNIKILRKKQAEELAKYKIVEHHCKEDKDKADKNQKRAMQLQEEIENLRAESVHIESQMKDIVEQRDHALKESESYARVLGQLEAKRGTAQTKQENIDDLRPHIKQLTEPDEELEAMQDQYDERVAQQKKEEIVQTERYEELRQAIERNRELMGEKQTQLGRFEAEKHAYEQQLQDRNALIKESARQYNIRGYDGVLGSEQIADFLNRLRRLSRDQERQLEKVQRESKIEIENARGVHTQLSEKRSVLNESKKLARENIVNNNTTTSKYQDNLDHIRVDEGSKGELESAIENIQGQLEKSIREFETSSWDLEISNAKSRVRSFEDQVAKLNNDLVISTNRAGELARLDYVRKELKDRQRGLDTIVGAYSERLKEHFGEAWRPDSLDKDYEDLKNEKVTALRNAELQRDSLDRELEQIEYKRSNANDVLQRKRDEYRECEEEVANAIGDREIESYEEVVEELRNRRDEYVQGREAGDSWVKYLQSCLDVSQKQKCCRLCKRVYRDESGLQSFKKHLEMLLAKASKDSYTDEEIEEVESELQKAQNASTSYDTRKRLLVEIPASEIALKELETRKSELITEVENLDAEVHKKAEEKSDVESLGKTVATITNYRFDINNFETQVNDLLAKHDDTLPLRKPEDVQAELKSLNEEGRRARQMETKLIADKESSRAHISSLELELRDVKSKLMDVNYKLEQKSNLLSQIEQLRQLNNEQRQCISRADKDIQDLEPEIEKARLKSEDLQQRLSRKESEYQKESLSLKESLRQFEKVNRNVNVYIDSGGPSNVARCQSEMKTFQGTIERLVSEQRDVTIAIKKIQEQLQNIEETKRSIHDNLRLRRDIRDLEVLHADIEELEAHNADVDLARLSRDIKNAEKQHTILAAEVAGKAGEMKSKDNQLGELLADWESDYKDAAYKYKEAHIKLEATRACVDDLSRYGNALDQAIMRYHSLKMAEINRIIEELWQRTYHGTDVDTILIRSDNETGKGNRSYNYRVCMVKQNAEMDMRGRCSAGQKVLSSIIIRLALAECFGVNCGLIALDEPTTNLDRDNIRCLAESLHTIIRQRQQQRNFQLIVITHDEEFLRHMQCQDFCDTYYEVKRNEKQCSIIERQNVGKLMQ